MGLNNTKPARDMGYQNVLYVAKKFVYGDNGKVLKLGTIPAYSLILKAASGVHVTTAFNAGSGNVLDIGSTSDDDYFGTDLALGTATFVPLDEAVGGFYVTSDTELTATPALSGTAATAGEGVIVIAFVPRIS